MASSASGGHGAYPEMTRSDPSGSDGPAEIPSHSTQVEFLVVVSSLPVFREGCQCPCRGYVLDDFADSRLVRRNHTAAPVMLPDQRTSP